MKIQIDILKEYIGTSNSKVLPVHVSNEISELLIVIKKRLLHLVLNYGPFEIIDNEIKFTEKDNITVPEEVIEFYFSFIDLISKLVNLSNITSLIKFLNDSFITCRIFSEILKF